MIDFETGLARSAMAVTLYTDSYVVRGTIETPYRRLSDLLNTEDRDFLVLENVVLEDFGTGDVVLEEDLAHINLATVLFGVADRSVETPVELRVVKIPERALVILPPFRVTGRIHLPPESDLRLQLSALEGRFLPVTEAVFWSDDLKVSRTEAPMVAINHARAHIFAPYEESA